MKINEYHRPRTQEAALALLAREELVTVPLGGGTWLNSPASQSAQFTTDIAVVDLQALGLNPIERNGVFIEIGAMVTLQGLLDVPELPEALQRAARLETTFNLRQAATVAGTLVAADGRSPFGAAMLALDARLTVLLEWLETPKGLGQASEGSVASEAIHLGDLLPLRRECLRQRLITKVAIPAVVHLEYEYVARTPADQPIVCAAVARWPSGRTRVCLGGYGSAPVLAMDGPEPGGAEAAARSAYSQAGDAWGSAAYRADMAAVLTNRCLANLAAIV